MTPLQSSCEIAQAIRALDSRLVAIELENGGDQRRLIYRYEVAGQIKPFYVPLLGEPVDLIVELYPEAQRFEEALLQQHEIQFRPPVKTA